MSGRLPICVLMLLDILPILSQSVSLSYPPPTTSCLFQLLSASDWLKVGHFRRVNWLKIVQVSLLSLVEDGQIHKVNVLGHLTQPVCPDDKILT